ncbi:molybdate ABC transporter substrate-binding protein [Sulfitobacter noctilucicola]|uniref:Molybdate transport system substrate-binding protein n=1 Tax=Sulfitobacter noctilucicola TaxID=1342301 RepID=A0A7W6MAF3_9RHOB|nr:molybdate ABC transporter substrate-binding protein [Sulfitobacter noctilucicola]MBB4174632.1 molybdate transport system substrate-binding protein [Sulfitobacter noctilucicola]
MTRIAAILTLFFAVFAVSAVAESRVTVFAAASLRGVLQEIAAQGEIDAVFSFGGSGTLARQVSAGAPADAVILANNDWILWLEQQGLITAKDVQPVVRNSLVVIAAAGTPPLTNAQVLPRLLADQRLAMGQRDAVPAGKYARQWLETEGLWETLTGNLAETDNVRTALALVARGQAPFGVVYATDALAEPAVDIVWEVPQTSHDPVLYPGAALTLAGKHFLALLNTPNARTIFATHGFLAVPE